MATPYVVSKLPLTKSNKEYEPCNCVDTRPTSSCSASIPTIGQNMCGFSSSWCAMCEKESSKNEPSRTSKIHSRTREEFLCPLDDFHVSGSPNNVANKNKNQLLSKYECKDEKLSSNYDKFTSVNSIFPPSSRDDVKTVEFSPAIFPNQLTGVHDKYVREVQVLKGKIQELRENLQKQFSEPAPESLISTYYPKILWNQRTVSNLPSDSLLQNGSESSQVVVNASEIKRIKRISDSEKTDSTNDVAGPKRLRDLSPHQKKNQFLKVKEDKEFPSCSRIATTLSFTDEKISSTVIPGMKLLGVENYILLRNLNRNVHPSLRLSLFHGVPPYIKFVNYENKADKIFPSAVSKVLRWKITTITPQVVRKTVINSGFKLVRQSPDWTGTWGKHMKSIMFRTIRENQKINHFPGTFQIGRKDKLWRNLHHLMSMFSKREFGFIPRTYVLPQDMKALRLAWEKGGNESMWIVKPPASARGTGIKVVNKWSQIPKTSPIIVQKYISNPYLINGNKFDLRLYALVTSFNPLRIYLYDNGLVRFASVKYSEDLACLSDRYMHLTNYSINKLSNNYHHNEDADACQGHKWTIKTLWSYLENTVDVKALWKRLVDLVIKTIMCGENSICSLTKSNLPSQYCSYELFGVDVLLDEHLRPWLLEVNISPSLHSASPLDLAVKGPMIKDILNIAGYQIPDLIPESQLDELNIKVGLDKTESLVFNKDLYIAGLSPSEKEKQDIFQGIDRVEYLNTILIDLTPDDLRQLIRYEDELTQIGSFEKIFPTVDTHSYLKYFEPPQYYNKLFDAWETKYAYDRSPGVALLQSLCEREHHLVTEDVSLHMSFSASEPSLTVDYSTASVSSAISNERTFNRPNSHPSPLTNETIKSKRRKARINLLMRPYGRFSKLRGRRPRTS